jgi:pyrrolidone-carboxylate peptidase
MRILLTAYGPFRDVTENITEVVVDMIEKNWDPKSGELAVLKLPVEWEQAETLLLDALTTLKPDLMVSLGHAQTYPAITVETRYFNTAEGEDNRGEMRAGGVIYRGEKEFYDTNINTDNLMHHLEEHHVPAVLHSGKEGMTYLCNFAGYVVMRHIARNGGTKPHFIFLHLPPNILPQSELVQGVTKTIEFLLSKNQ